MYNILNNLGLLRSALYSNKVSRLLSLLEYVHDISKEDCPMLFCELTSALCSSNNLTVLLLLPSFENLHAIIKGNHL